MCWVGAAALSVGTVRRKEGVLTCAFTSGRLIIHPGLHILVDALTPEPVVGHLGTFFPMVGMMEVSVLVGKKVERDRAKKSGNPLQSDRIG